MTSERPSDRPSFSSDLRAALRFGSLIRGVLVALIAGGSALGAVALRVDALSTDVERDAAIKAALDGLERERASRAHAEAQEARDRRTVERAMMRRLVSYDAADRESDKRRKAEASRIAREALSSQCAAYHTSGHCAGMTLDQAADFALDAR